MIVQIPRPSLENMAAVRRKRKRSEDDDHETDDVGEPERRHGQEPSGRVILSDSPSETLSEGQTSEDSISSSDEDEEDDVDEAEEETSSSGSSDDESSGGSESDNVVNLTGSSSRPPKITAQPPLSDLGSRLSALLPELKQANAELHSSLDKQLDHVPDDEEHYIEMDLGLGVLKETQRTGIKDIKTAVGEDSSSDETSPDSDQQDVVQRTLGHKKSKSQGISEVDGG